MFSKFKVELHCHTKESSPCGHVLSHDLIDAYIEKEYDGVVITDHYGDYVFGKDEDIVSRFLDGYKKAIEYAEDRIKVYLGLELTLKENLNDYLLFGDVYKLLALGREVFNLPLKKAYEVIKENDLAIFQAHPNRNHMVQMPYSFLDGIEIYNMHTEHNSRNYKSVKYARENNVRGISGSDAHQIHHVGRGGILIDVLPNNENELKDILLNDNYELYF